MAIVTLPSGPLRPTGRTPCLALVVACALMLEARGPGASPAQPARPSTGTIRGTVTLANGVRVPPPTVVDSTTDAVVCGTRHEVQSIVLATSGRGLRHVIVALDDVKGAAPSHFPRPVVIDNANCRFEPHVSVATVGARIEALNSDRVLHTTHLTGPAEVNLALPFKGAKLGRQLVKPGLYVVKCDMHSWMQAFVRVDWHPFHAVTDSTGAFEIKDVPEGTYTLEAWHESLGTIRRQVTVRAGGASPMRIEYSQTTRPPKG